MDTTKMSVEEIREELVKLGMTQDEADSIKGKSNLTDKLNELSSGPVSMDELTKQPDDDTPIVAENVGDEKPLRTSPLWHDYVMRQFAEDEMVENPDTKEKLPTVDGLRRVTEVLIGDIVASMGQVNKSPNSDDRTATVTYTVQIDTGSRVLTYGGISDTSIHNIEGSFAKYLTSIAETRAEGRALRKALGLKKIVAAEEVISPVSETDFKPEQKITEMQIMVIDKGCKQNDIDVMKFANSGTLKYNNIKEVKYETAVNMCMYINEYARGAIAIPESIKGYNPNWKD